MSLQIWLPLNGDLTQQGLSNATVTASTTPTYTDNGKIGKALSRGKIKIDSTTAGTIFNNKSCSMAFWYNNGGSTGSHAICGVQGNAEGTNGTEPRQWDFFNYPTKNDFHWSMGSISSGVLNGIIPDDTWIHFAFVLGDGKFTIYKNGSVIWQGSSNPTFTTYAYDYYISFGHAQYMNDFRIYDHALSVKEVQELAKGLVLHYRLAGPGQENLIKNSTFAEGTLNWYGVNNSVIKIEKIDNKLCLTATKGTTANLYGFGYVPYATAGQHDIYTFSADIYTTAAATWTCGIMMSTTSASGWQGMSVINQNYYNTQNLKVGWNHVKFSFECYHSSYTGNLQIYFGCPNFDGYYLHMPKLEKGSIATPWTPNPADTLWTAMGYSTGIEYDCSGYQHNGIPVSATTRPTWDADSPRYTTSFNYSGKTNQANYTTSTDMNFIDNFSWAVWIKPNYTAGNAQFVFTGGRADAGGYGYGLQVASATYCTIFYGNNGRYAVGAKSGEWHHVAFTKTGTTCKCYLDGKLISTNTFGGTNPTYSDGNGVGIGCFHYSGNIYPYFGKASDLRIYATCLSDDDIAELYHSAVIIDNTGKTYAYEYFEG